MQRKEDRVIELNPATATATDYYKRACAYWLTACYTDKAMTYFLEALVMRPDDKVFNAGFKRFLDDYLLFCPTSESQELTLGVLKTFPREVELKLLNDAIYSKTLLSKSLRRCLFTIPERIVGSFNPESKNAIPELVRSRYDELTRERVAVRHAARLFAQGHRASFFFPSKDIFVNYIAPNLVDDMQPKLARQIAQENFCRPGEARELHLLDHTHSGEEPSSKCSIM